MQQAKLQEPPRPGNELASSVASNGTSKVWYTTGSPPPLLLLPLPLLIFLLPLFFLLSPSLLLPLFVREGGYLVSRIRVWHTKL